MRFITVSILSVLVVMPTVAVARLPVVNIASAGVSARSAFGEEVTKTNTKAAESTRTRSVVARTIQKPITATQEELDVNQRSRSAKLRAIVKI